MVIVDDPMLALIMRFVAKGEPLDASNQEYMQQQVAAMQEYVSQFPDEERTQRGIEWVAKYAERYRQEWQRSAATRQYTHHRCPDCPLVANASASHCEIHQRWLELLENYANSKISSTKYVGDALELLQQHKSQLQINTKKAVGE